MPLSFFFEKKTVKAGFQSKLNAAMQLIKENESLIAGKVLEVIETDKVEIHSFYDLQSNHYDDLKKDFLETNIILPAIYPPTRHEVNIIESQLNGIIFDNHCIYISSKNTPQDMANAIIHEVGHFLNFEICRKQAKKNFNMARYSDEVRSFTAERMFERNGHCLTRSDIKMIHEKVMALYPEYDDPTANASLGYIFSAYDKCSR